MLQSENAVEEFGHEMILPATLSILWKNSSEAPRLNVIRASCDALHSVFQPNAAA